MDDIGDRLRAAMHAAVDAEQPSPGELIRLVMRRHRRRNVLVAGAAAVVALAVAVSAAIALRSVTVTPPPSTHRHAVAPAPHKMTGLPMPTGTNLQFLVQNGQHFALFSTATLRSQPISGVPNNLADGGQVERVEGGWWVSAFRRASYCSKYECAGPPARYYFIAYGSLTATRVGSGVVDRGLSPGDHAGELWLVSYPRKSDNMTTTSARAQLVSTSGQPLGPLYHLPAGYLIDRGVGNYLLLTRQTRPYGYALWNPRTRQVVRRLDNVVAASGEQIAWIPACAGCHMQLLNASTGASVTTPVPGFATWNYNGVFSDDGRLLAVQLPDGATPNSQGPTRLAVLNTASTALTVIQGATLSFSEWQTFGWQGASHRLVVSAGPGTDYTTNAFAGPVQVAYWQPGDARLRVATVRNHDEIPVVQGGHP
jgi:hypothetical protein